MFRNNQVFLLLVLVAGVLLVSGSAVAEPAAPAFLAQISDMHLSAVDTALSANTSALQSWVSSTNALPVRPVFAVNTGDLADDVSAGAAQTFALYNQTLAALTFPHLTVPGNHDYQGPDQFGYDQFGYATYPTANAAGLWLVGSDVINNAAIDFPRLAANLAANQGRAPAVLLQHYPLNTPDWLTCNNQNCTAPKWILSAADRAQVRQLAAEYDLYGVLGGHVHAGYVTYDRATRYENFLTIVAPALYAKKYNVIVLWNDHLAAQMVRAGQPTPVIVEPAPYDNATDLGQVVDFTATKVQALAYGRPARAMRLRVGVSSSPWYTMQLVDGVWEGTYNWARMRAGVSYQLTVEATYADGTTAAATQNVRRAPASDPGPVIRTANAAWAGQTLAASGTVQAQYTISDAGNAAGKLTLYLDGRRVAEPASYAGDYTYTLPLADLAAGEHRLYLKAVDAFGRTVRSAREVFTVAPDEKELPPTPTATATATPTMTPTLTSTPTATATPPSQPGDAGCQAGSLTLRPVWDSYIFTPGATKPGDAQPLTAALLRNGDTWPFYRTLLAFDLTGIPAAATITAATLQLEVQSWYPVPATSAPTALLQWLARPTDALANWSNATATTTWQTPGAAAAESDYRAAGAVQQKLAWGVNRLAVADFLTAGRAQPNYGWRLTVAGSGAAFYATETAGRGPLLTVTFTCP